MTRPDLDALAALLDKATQPTWQPGFAGQSDDPRACNLVSFDGDDIVGVAYVPSDRNRALIVALRNAAPALLAYVRELERDQIHAIASARRDAEHAAALAMRERCAQACDPNKYVAANSQGPWTEGVRDGMQQCVTAIRALEV